MRTEQRSDRDGPLDSLTAFDVSTGVSIGVNSVTASLNDRKEFLVRAGVVNKVGLEQDGLRVTEGGRAVVGGHRLSEVNAALARRGHGDLTLVPTATFRRKLGTTYRRLPETALNLVNPPPVPRLLGDKAMQYWEFFRERVAVPPFQPLDGYATMEASADALVADFIDDAPLVLKARRSTHGRDVHFYPGGVEAVVDDWRSGRAPRSFLDAPDEYLLQYAVPHDSDLRVVAAGATPVAAERRYGSPDTDRSNLSLVETGAGSLRTAARRLLSAGAVEPVTMDVLDPAVERAVADLATALSERADPAPERVHTWVGWDLLEVDPADPKLDAVPEDVLSGLLVDRYRTADGRYLVFGEGNLSPGSKERYVNALAHGRAGLGWDSAANLLGYLESISRSEQFERGVPPALDRETLADTYGL